MTLQDAIDGLSKLGVEASDQELITYIEQWNRQNPEFQVDVEDLSDRWLMEQAADLGASLRATIVTSLDRAPGAKLANKRSRSSKVRSERGTDKVSTDLETDLEEADGVPHGHDSAQAHGAHSTHSAHSASGASGDHRATGGGVYEAIGQEIEAMYDEARHQRDTYVEREASRIVGLVEAVPDLILDRVREKLQGANASPARFRAGVRAELGYVFGTEGSSSD